jgi:hypothetical protein
LRHSEKPGKSWLARLAPAIAGVALSLAHTAFAFDYGLNLHMGGGNATNNQTIANIAGQRNLKVGRFDYHSTSEVTNLRDQINRLIAVGGKAQLIIENNWDPNGACPQNFAQVETDSYNKTFPMVQAMKDIVHDYEILNEIQNRPEIMAQVTKNSQLMSTAGYHASPCSMTVAYVARGIARAIHDNGQRAILGVVGRDFGFLYFMREMGVTWDVTGAHFYQNYTNASLLNDSWWGTNGPLYQLSLFGKPITVNEFNCGEIYNYPNIDYESCLKSVNKQLTELNANPYGTIESVLFYELTDEPGNGGAEGVFGLMTNLTSPKTGLYLASAWACGQLSSTEKQLLTSRGLRDGSTCSGTGTTTPPPTTTTPPPTTTTPPPTTTPPADTIAPTVTISNPANGQTLSRRGYVTVQASATDNVGVNWMGFYLNGTPLCTGNITSCTMRMPNWRGAQTIEVRAADAAMNHGTKSITVYTR